MHQVAVSDFLIIMMPLLFGVALITILLSALAYFIFYVVAVGFTKGLYPWVANRLRHGFALGTLLGIIFTAIPIAGLNMAVEWRADILLVFAIMATVGFLGWMMSWQAFKEARQSRRIY